MIDSGNEFENLITLRHRFETEKQGERVILEDGWKPNLTPLHVVMAQQPHTGTLAPVCQTVGCDSKLTITDGRGICRQCILERG